MQIRCKKCKYAWEYAGNKHRTSCPKCKTSVTLSTISSMVHVSTGVIEGEPVYRVTSHLTEVKLPLKLLDSIAFAKAKAWAKTNGQDYIELKPNSEGVLSLA